MNFNPFLVFCFLLFLTSCNSGSKNQTPQVNVGNSKDIKTEKTPPMNKRVKNLNTDYCMGKFDPDAHADFESIPIQYADREGMYIRKDVFTAYKKMYEAAKKDGVNLQIRSATRNFFYQKGIWERKWTGTTILSDGTNASTDISDPVQRARKILEYSSMPGTSRHHWGTDIDLNAFNNAYFESGAGKKIYDWLKANAGSYGFCQPYTPKGPDRPHGYNEEKWHWTYKPLGSEITAFATEHLKNVMISGFKGAETASEIDVVGKYVLGINQGCNH